MAQISVISVSNGRPISFFHNCTITLFAFCRTLNYIIALRRYYLHFVFFLSRLLTELVEMCMLCVRCFFSDFPPQFFRSNDPTLVLPHSLFYFPCHRRRLLAFVLCVVRTNYSRFQRVHQASNTLFRFTMEIKLIRLII